MAAMAYLTWAGAHAGAPDQIDLKVPATAEAGKQVANQSGCGACHKFGEAGNPGPGPDLTQSATSFHARRSRDAAQPDRADAFVRRAAAEEVQRAGGLPGRASLARELPRCKQSAGLWRDDRG